MEGKIYDYARKYYESKGFVVETWSNGLSVTAGDFETVEVAWDDVKEVATNWLESELEGVRNC